MTLQEQHQPCIHAVENISCNSSQVRHVIYHKGLEGDFDIVSPMAYGGLGSEQYKAINPLNKVCFQALLLDYSQLLAQYSLVFELLGPHSY